MWNWCVRGVSVGAGEVRRPRLLSQLLIFERVTRRLAFGPAEKKHGKKNVELLSLSSHCLVQKLFRKTTFLLEKALLPFFAGG